MKQKTIKTTFVMLLIFAAAGSSARATTKDRKAEKVMNDYVSVIGGKTALSGIQNLVSQSELKFIESVISIDREITETSGNEYYIKVSSPRIGEIIRGSDGHTCWEKRQSAVKPIEGEEKRRFLNSSYFLRYANWENHLTDYKYEGKVIIDGAEMSKIAVTTNYGYKETWYFNNDSHYLAQTEEPLDLPEGISTVTTTFADYKDVGGIKLPFTHIIKMPGQTRIISFAEIKANQVVENTIFSLPK